MAESAGLDRAMTMFREAVLHDDSTRLVEKIRAAGGSIDLGIDEDMHHIRPVFQFLPEGDRAVEHAGRFIAEPVAVAA